MTSHLGESDGRRGRARLAFAQLIPESTLFSFGGNRELLEESVVAGTSAERHNRVWRMGQRALGEDFLLGRLGFTNADTPTEIWDEERKDFVEAAYPNGFTSPFAIRISDLVVSFQLRSGHIKFQSFAGALQALMREASGDAWRVEALNKPITFERWRASVDRVLTMNFTLWPPNPNYKGRPLIKEVIAKTSSDQLRFIFTADPDDLLGLDTDADFLRQAVTHAAKGYGDFRAVGERPDDEGDVRRVKFDSKLGETDVVPVSADPETGEVSHATLTEELADRHTDRELESEQEGGFEP